MQSDLQRGVMQSSTETDDRLARAEKMFPKYTVGCAISRSVPE